VKRPTVGYRVIVWDENGDVVLRQADFMLEDSATARASASAFRRKMVTEYPHDYVEMCRLHRVVVIEEGSPCE